MARTDTTARLTLALSLAGIILLTFMLAFSVAGATAEAMTGDREEHTSELQSRI